MPVKKPKLKFRKPAQLKANLNLSKIKSTVEKKLKSGKDLSRAEQFLHQRPVFLLSFCCLQTKLIRFTRMHLT